MANFGPIPVPDALAPVLPYAKFVVGLAGVVATVAAGVLAGPPVWVFYIIAAATALGVLGAPNQNLAAEGVTAVKDAENVVADVQGKDFGKAVNDAGTTVTAVTTVVTDVKKEVPGTPGSSPSVTPAPPPAPEDPPHRPGENSPPLTS